MKFKQIVLVIIFLIAVFYVNESLAQCAMCRANAESNLKSGGTIAKGLNTGILYLMTVPYIILVTLFFIFFKKQIIEKIKAIKSKLIST